MPPTYGTDHLQFLSQASAEDLIDEARNGRMFVIIEDGERGQPGVLVVPADAASADCINFMARYARGLICLALTEERCRCLGLVPMSSRYAAQRRAEFAVSIEARDGVSTGISAADRARTIATAVDPASAANDLVSPGHVFPLIVPDSGLLQRQTSAEASVDIARLAGRMPAGVTCYIMDDDGQIADRTWLSEFAVRHNLKIGLLSSLVEHRQHHRRQPPSANGILHSTVPAML
jgi:3,4-dihydroxy 2-butanone 4-phosphate synthase/GTP cyclohydrolase II